MARRMRMDPMVRVAVQGHKPRTEGERYGGNVPLYVKWTEIHRLRRYDVQPLTEPRVSKREVEPKDCERAWNRDPVRRGANRLMEAGSSSRREVPLDSAGTSAFLPIVLPNQ